MPDLNAGRGTGAGDPILKDYLVSEFVEEYSEGRMTRRDALQRLIAITGSLTFANGLLAACSPPPAASPTAVPSTQAPSVPTAAVPAVLATTAPTAGPTAAGPGQAAAPYGTVPANDPTIQAENVQFPGNGTTLMGYLARPRTGSQLPIVLVCHENRGLVEHIKDVTRRFGRAGYAALAVDLLSRQGGTDKVDAAQVPGILANQPADQMVGDFKAGLAYMQGLSFVRKDRAGMTGFCFGGGITWRCATGISELRAAVPYYGPNPPLEQVAQIQASVLALYGELDTRIDAGIPAIEAAMKQNGKTYEKVIYPNANHAFNNDTGGSYNAEAARDAWAKTLAWFEKYLRS